MKNHIKKSLAELGFSENEIRIYLALTQLGEAPAAHIAKKADLPRTTAISILEKLSAGNYLTTHKYKGTTYYWVESPHALIETLESKIGIAQELGDLLTGLYRTDSHFPFAETFDTKTNIKNFIHKIISESDKKSIIYTIDTPGEGNYSKIFDDEIGKFFSVQKAKKQILTRTLIPCGAFQDIKPEKLQVQNIEIREMPQEIKFRSSLWLMNDKVIFFSGNPPFVTAIKHEAIHAGIKSIYDYLWNISGEKN